MSNIYSAYSVYSNPQLYVVSPLPLVIQLCVCVLRHLQLTLQDAMVPNDAILW
jgi:hypothetical protein